MLAKLWRRLFGKLYSFEYTAGSMRVYLESSTAEGLVTLIRASGIPEKMRPTGLIIPPQGGSGTAPPQSLWKCKRCNRPLKFADATCVVCVLEKAAKEQGDPPIARFGVDRPDSFNGEPRTVDCC